ncbi:hypothetical protein ACFWXK_40010 [Streptomyces sp. NPDC059070]|uniref:hypothetical protein n=1 Tax=Streptomyces sp. NPDC059070 TaxID=3346713 RepID=UPI0036889D3C
MALKAGVFILWTALLVLVNAYVIEPFWGQLVSTAVVAGAMALCLSNLGRRT